MSQTKFILYVLIYMIIGYIMVFRVAPKFIENSHSINTNPTELAIPNELKISNHPEGKDVGDNILWKRYLFVDFYIPNHKSVRVQFDLPDEEDTAFLELLRENDLIKDMDAFPISYSGEEIDFIKKLEVIYTKENKLQYLAINDDVTIGTKAFFKKYAVLVLGYFLMIIGGLGLIFLPVGAYIQIRDYNRKGTPFNVLNKFEGIKIFFRIFNKKDN